MFINLNSIEIFNSIKINEVTITDNVLVSSEQIQSKIISRPKYLIGVTTLVTIWFLWSHLRATDTSFRSWTLSDMDLNKDAKINQDEFLQFLIRRDPVPTSSVEFIKLSGLSRDSLINFDRYLEIGLSHGFPRHLEKLYFHKLAWAYFKRTDTNNDGFITTGEWLGLMEELQLRLAELLETGIFETFNALDLTRDDHLTGKDFDEQRLYRVTDQDWDKRISFIEFISLRMKDLRTADKAAIFESYNEVFQKFDKSKDGYLQQDEFLRLVRDERRQKQYIHWCHE